MRLAIPTLILAVILVLGWRVCSGGDTDHLRFTEEDLPAELRQGYPEAADPESVAEATGEAEAPEAAETETESAAIAASSERAPTPAEPAVPEPPVAATAADAGPEIQVPALPAVSADTPPAPPANAAPVAAPAAAPAQETPEATTTQGGRLYVVQPGDWLRQIAREQYGDAARARDIARANDLSNPNSLRPGQKLVLP